MANNGCIMKLTEISFRLLTLPLLVILVGCVTVNDSTVKHMSTAKLCEFLSPKWITLPSERKAVRSEVSSRGASCSPGSPAPVRQKARKESAGTGFIVSEVGHILTNHHVVKGCRTVVASRTDMIDPVGMLVQPKLDAPKTREERSIFEDRGLRVIGVDARSDLALLKMARPSSTVAAFRGGRGVRTGEDIVITGFPLPGLLTSDLNVTKGIVSALAGLRDDRSRIQITAPVQPGNSGGPVLGTSTTGAAVAMGTRAIRQATRTKPR